MKTLQERTPPEAPMSTRTPLDAPACEVFIRGEWRESRASDFSPIVNPATEGAELALDGRQIPAPAAGYFLGATIFDRVRPEMALAREEIFGPLLSVIRATSLEEAIEVVNRSQYGNATAIFTRDGGAARQYCSRVTSRW